MIQRIWYYTLRVYVWLGLHFYFRKIIIHGRENIPTGHPILFTPNHQNAFMDALLVVTSNGSFTHFLTRADIFKKGFVHWLLSTINLVPIYRIRDGWNALDRNQETFNQCTELFEKGESILIFPEGNHGKYRRLRPLSKGFTRVVFEALQKDPSLQLYIVPVGLNYTAHRSFFSSVSVYYGKPLLTNSYFDQPQPNGANQLRQDLAQSMQNLITHVDDEENYDSIMARLEQTHPDYLDPFAVNAQLKALPALRTSVTQATADAKLRFLFLPLYYALLLINLIPLALWTRFERGIKDPVFVASLKFGFGIVAFPLTYLIEVLLVSLAGHSLLTLAATGVCLVSMPVLKTLERVFDIPRWGWKK